MSSNERSSNASERSSTCEGHHVAELQNVMERIRAAVRLVVPSNHQAYVGYATSL